MNIILDCVKLQKEQGVFSSKRKITANTKDDATALKELVEMLQAICSESIDRDLPLDKAFAALHVKLVKREPNTGADFYQKILDDYRNVAPLKHIRQDRRGVTVLQHLHDHYQEANKIIKENK